MLELQIKQQPGTIEFENYSQLKQDLEAQIKPYESLVFTDEQYGEAKKTRASLNNLKKAIVENRQLIKAEFTKPYIAYEAQSKEMEAIVNRGVANVDSFVKGYDSKEKEDKKQTIELYFSTLNFTLIPLARLWEESWLNRTCSEKQWKEQLSGKIESIKVSLALLEQMNVEDKETLKAMYLDCLDMTVATHLYESQQERKRQLEEARKVTELEQEEKVQANTPVYQKPAENAVSVSEKKEELFTRSFRVMNCTRQQIIDLGNWMNAQDIKFEKIEEE